MLLHRIFFYKGWAGESSAKTRIKCSLCSSMTMLSPHRQLCLLEHLAHEPYDAPLAPILQFYLLQWKDFSFLSFFCHSREQGMPLHRSETHSILLCSVSRFYLFDLQMETKKTLRHRDIYTNVYIFQLHDVVISNYQALQKCSGAIEVRCKAEETVMDDQYQWWRSAKAGDHWASVKTRSYVITSEVIITIFTTCYCENFNYISKNTAYNKSYSSEFLL